MATPTAIHLPPPGAAKAAGTGSSAEPNKAGLFPPGFHFLLTRAPCEAAPDSHPLGADPSEPLCPGASGSANTCTGAACSGNAPALPFLAGQTVAQAVYLSGLVEPPSLCSGLGQCGQCRMRLFMAPVPAPAAERPGKAAPILPEDAALLCEADLAAGYRLACHHPATEGMAVFLPPDARKAPGPVEASAPASVQATLHRGALAVDLGTTSVQWVLLKRNEASGRVEQVAAGAFANPQAGAGSDLVSRLACVASPQGAATLARLTRAALARLVAEARGRGILVQQMVLAANPAMTAITLGYDTGGLAAAPYSLPFSGWKEAKVEGLPPLRLPAPASPFVGGDCTAGYAAILAEFRGREAEAFPFLLADLGTNGEFLLAVNSRQTLAASVALGPALEGIGLTFGVAAEPGAITGFALSPQGLVPQWYADTPCQRPTGITGTGYISLLGILRKAGAMQASGHLSPGPHLLSRAEARYGAELADRAGIQGPALPRTPYFALPHGMFLSARDVEELLKVKAAFSLGLERLLAGAGLPCSDLANIFLAGAMGLHADVHALCSLGFLPDDVNMARKVRAVGNTSLKGAILLAVEALDHGTESISGLADWASGVEAVNLAEDPAFQAGYVRHMVFSPIR